MQNKVLYLLRIITDCCTVIGAFKIWKPSNILNLIIGLISRIWPSWVFRQQVCTWTNCKKCFSSSSAGVYSLFTRFSQKLTDTVVTQYSWLQGPASQASESGRHRRNTRRITVIYPSYPKCCRNLPNPSPRKTQLSLNIKDRTGFIKAGKAQASRQASTLLPTEMKQ